ncbi:hypothetical protein [Burkholderia contaminans]|uniref:hypothetical protein n=1 Tax=Burkholderia contaminans TaxID=488447 RepID=UPI001581994C|nr:hypothetical protein [Burkholderia contaminans]
MNLSGVLSRDAAMTGHSCGVDTIFMLTWRVGPAGGARVLTRWMKWKRQGMNRSNRLSRFQYFESEWNPARCEIDRYSGLFHRGIVESEWTVENENGRIARP